MESSDGSKTGAKSAKKKKGSKKRKSRKAEILESGGPVKKKEDVVETKRGGESPKKSAGAGIKDFLLDLDEEIHHLTSSQKKDLQAGRDLEESH
jgi:hypothetical protein